MNQWWAYGVLIGIFVAVPTVWLVWDLIWGNPEPTPKPEQPDDDRSWY